MNLKSLFTGNLHLHPEPILPICKIRKLHRPPETPGGPLAPKFNFSFISEFGQGL